MKSEPMDAAVIASAVAGRKCSAVEVVSASLEPTWTTTRASVSAATSPCTACGSTRMARPEPAAGFTTTV